MCLLFHTFHTGDAIVVPTETVYGFARCFVFIQRNVDGRGVVDLHAEAIGTIYQYPVPHNTDCESWKEKDLVTITASRKIVHIFLTPISEEWMGHTGFVLSVLSSVTILKSGLR